MASVLLCEDERLGRQVAVKRLHADSPVDVEQRFTREAKLGASLNHPNLVSVFDTATDDEGVLIVMEYVEGEPLSRMLRRGPLRPEEVSAMVRDLGEALDHAHSQGVVHRDVKPGNVLIREDGVAKLADLGIATASDGTKITRSGTVLGTVAYMAPEQLDGRGAGPPADVYALAAISFEALSGKRPREGSTPLEIAHRIATEGAPDLLDVWPTAPKEAARVLKRGMASESEERPGSAGEFARELTHALEDAPEEATEKTRFLGRRSKAAAAAPAAAAAATPAAAQAQPDPRPRRSTRRPPRLRRPSRRRGARRRHSRRRPVPGGVPAPAPSRWSPSSSRSPRPRLRAPFSRVGTTRTPRRRVARTTAHSRRPTQDRSKKEPKAEKQPKESAPAPAPADEQQGDSGSYDEARGAELNTQGFDLMSAGNYDDAVPVLQEAVNSFPPDTQDLNYAYALFNLGKSLRLAGRPDEAIPVLEKRLEIPNQTKVVEAELKKAKKEAGKG